MGYVNEPPQHPQIAEAQDVMMQWLNPVTIAKLKLISRSIRINGTISEQEAFKLEYSEIRGIAQRALAKGGKAEADRAKVECEAAVTDRIINNEAYAKFWMDLAGGEDSLMR